MEEVKNNLIYGIKEEARKAKKTGLTKRQFLFCEFIKIFFDLNFCYWIVVLSILFFEK